jgi:prokaryotic ubiquitin-like protein Pup
MQCVRVGSRRAGEDSVEIAVGTAEHGGCGMATNTGGQRQTPRRAEDEQDSEVRDAEEVRERQDKLTDDVDAILDEIDEVLEENAEEFVRSYVQKGGE